MKRIVTATYQCEICKREWATPAQAKACESSPRPALEVGDVVLWRGQRDDYPDGQPFVLDVVTDVNVSYPHHAPEHRVRYTLGKQYGLDQNALKDPQHGRVNLQNFLGGHLIHDDRLESALDSMANGDMAPVIKLLRRALPFGGFAAQGIPALYKTEYGFFFGRQRTETTFNALSPEDSQMLQAITREPTDEECWLWLLDSRAPSMDRWVDMIYSQFWHCGVIVDLDFDRALHMISFDEQALLARIRAYRQDALNGAAHFHDMRYMHALFPLDDSKAQGKWSPAMMAWVKQHQIKGAGPARLKRVREAIQATRELKRVKTMKMRLWTEKIVIGVAAGKGGVGKSTLAAGIARSLAQSGVRAMYFDADFYGASAPVLFPVKKPRFKTQDGKLLPHVVDGVEVMSLGYLLDPAETVEWRGPMLGAAFHILAANTTTEAEVVVVDLPAGTGDVAQALFSFCPQARLIMVATAGEMALSDVRRATAQFSAYHKKQLWGVIENMAYFADDPNRRWLFGDQEDVPQFAAETGLTHLGTLPLARTAEERRAAIESLNPAAWIAQIRNGKRPARDVSLRVLNDDLKELLDEWKKQIADEKGGISAFRRITTPSSLQENLRTMIIRRGGDPDEAKYKAWQKKAHQRLSSLLADRLERHSFTDFGLGDDGSRE